METKFNQRLKKLMMFYDLNQRTLSEVTGLSYQTIDSLIVKGNPNFNILIKLLKFFKDINPHWLLFGEGQMVANQSNIAKLNEPGLCIITREEYDFLKTLCEKDRKELEQLRKINAELSMKALRLCSSSDKKVNSKLKLIHVRPK
ncbi:hypothetical protein SDC9_17952 [bioreactor metagenome]|uniref:HTH cro/C1-type domain-containing protein n=1 Tax=bioreactor metagenome TaxID=1076179 RepID=A0A644U151_9ZZZZ|nr:helix-turn-helix transcriptional regulator [Lentimicrobium sp.]MEA5110946.1 helix-turn-helix transcriptional regulator [Lentimicrobium sp.]